MNVSLKAHFKSSNEYCIERSFEKLLMKVLKKLSKIKETHLQSTSYKSKKVITLNTFIQCNNRKSPSLFHNYSRTFAHFELLKNFIIFLKKFYERN